MTVIPSDRLNSYQFCVGLAMKDATAAKGPEI
jgi:hypothetical protein